MVQQTGAHADGTRDPADRTSGAAKSLLRTAGLSLQRQTIPGSVEVRAEDGPTPVTATTVQQDIDITKASIWPDYAKQLSEASLHRDLGRIRPLATRDEGLRENLRILLDELSHRRLRVLAEQGEDFARETPAFRMYCEAVTELEAAGGQPSEDPDAVGVPATGCWWIVSEDGTVELLSPQDVVQIGDDLVPVLEQIAIASNGNGDPGFGGSLGHVLLWTTAGRSPRLYRSQPISRHSCFGTPASFTAAENVSGLHKPWERVRDASVSGVLRWASSSSGPTDLEVGWECPYRLAAGSASRTQRGDPKGSTRNAARHALHDHLPARHNGITPGTRTPPSAQLRTTSTTSIQKACIRCSASRGKNTPRSRLHSSARRAVCVGCAWAAGCFSSSGLRSTRLCTHRSCKALSRKPLAP